MSAQARREMQRSTLLPITPPIFFPEKENGRCDRPKERRFPLQASNSKRCSACRLHCPARGVAAFPIAIRLDLLLLPAAALPILFQCGRIPSYRQSHQGGERSKAAGAQAVRRQTTVTRAPRSRARLISVTTRRRLVAQPCTPHPHCAARAVIQATNPQCRGARGTPLVLSLGGLRGILSFEKESIPL